MKIGTVIRVVIGGLIVVGLVMLTGCAAYQQGLGPALETIEPTPPGDSPAALATMEPTLSSEALTATAAVIPTELPPVATPTIAQTAVCGETAAWNLLILGADTIALRGDIGSDLTRLFRLDFPNRRVTVYAFSRDLWVNTSDLGLSYPTINATELGTVFYEAFRRSSRGSTREAMVDGTNAMARMLLWNFSVRTDHYVTVDMLQVPAMIDAVGGIPINIPERTTDPWIGMVIQPGQQTLTGAQASAYARAKPDSDFGRINRQQLLFEAMRMKLLDPAVWIRIPQLYMQFNQVIATDLSLEQINHLACLLNEVPREAIIQEGVRQEWTWPGPQGSFLWDRNNVTNWLMELGLIP
jgi:LCP family protein required for cell wall assembly